MIDVSPLLPPPFLHRFLFLEALPSGGELLSASPCSKPPSGDTGVAFFNSTRKECDMFGPLSIIDVLRLILSP